MPAIDGDANASRKLKNFGTVTGDTNQYVSPGPVTNICPPDQLAPLIFDSAQIQAFRDSASSVLVTVEVEDDGLTLTGVVHVTADLNLTGNVVLSGNVVFIVDGNVHLQGGSHLGLNGNLLVASGHFHSQGGSTMSVEHQEPVDPNLSVIEEENNGGAFIITAWRQSQD